MYKLQTLPTRGLRVQSLALFAEPQGALVPFCGFQWSASILMLGGCGRLVVVASAFAAFHGETIVSFLSEDAHH